MRTMTRCGASLLVALGLAATGCSTQGPCPARSLLVEPGPATAPQDPSGLRPGEEVSAWEPVHVAGPHAGTKTCPVCTYPDDPVVLAFAKAGPDTADLAGRLEGLTAAHRGRRLRVLLVVLDGTDDGLKTLAADKGLKAVMLCRPDPDTRDKVLKAYKVRPEAANTVLVYRDYTVTDNFVGLAPEEFGRLEAAVRKLIP